MAQEVKVKVGKLNSTHDSFREGYEYAGICSCGYFSIGWPTKNQAKKRIDAHKNEHDTGEEMPDRREVEAITPKMFTSDVTQPQPESNPLWDEVN